MKCQVSQIYILWTPQNSLKIQHPKNLIVKNFNKLFAKIAFLLLFKCNFFFPNCSSLMLLFSIYPILVCEQFFNIWFTSWTFLSRSFFYFLILKLEKTVLVFGEVCLTFLTIFSTEFWELIPFMMSFVPACIIMQSGFSARF